MEGILARFRKPEEIGDNEFFEVHKGESVFIGSNPASIHTPSRKEKNVKIKGIPTGSLADCTVEISINNQGNPRIKRFPSREIRHEITIWGRDITREGNRGKYYLSTTLPDSVYKRIDGGSIVVDIRLEATGEKSILRLTEAERIDGVAKSFRVELDPKKLDLSK
ncbi:hypothetical protein IID22_00215 [Patescibacteria group bacterium]|nr:hypothetical protein [Patescibacteria group bacterium]